MLDVNALVRSGFVDSCARYRASIGCMGALPALMVVAMKIYSC
jgi:hypothetical protein